MCSKAFLNEEDLIAHWETGTCSEGIERQRVNDVFVAADAACAFLNSKILDRGPDGKYKAPRLANGQTYDGVWTGNLWKCPRCTQHFRDRAALKAHLDSSAHEPQIYACTREYGGCDTSYATLSAFVRHAANAGSGRCLFSKKYLDRTLACLRCELFRPTKKKN